MKNRKNEKNALCAVNDEELSSACGGSKYTSEEFEAAGYLRALGKVAGEGTVAGVFFNAAANKMRDLAVLNA